MNAAPKTRGRVLIVDDEPQMLEGMKMLLELEGNDVIIHDSMITLPLILREADPDVVLLDISLPALSGSSALRNGLRKMLRTDGVILLFSGRSDRELTVLTKELGADGFIGKAGEPMEIVGQVRMWINRRRMKRANDRSEGANGTNRTAFAAAR